MAPPLTWLTHLKSSQLRIISAATGLNSSGTKPTLLSQLQSHLPTSAFSPSHEAPENSFPTPPGPNIISIDMGIRNLAYCRLHAPPTPPFKPVISEWARLAISARAEKSNNEPETPAIKETFDPATYSQYAYDLMSKLLRPSQPTHILIERQRFRSMGGSAVQEWTLRVNMFEAMLYAVLKTLGERGVWRGRVYAVAPAKVSKFWLGEGEGAGDGERREKGEGKGKGKSKSARTKTAKIGLVEDWLEEGERFRLEGEAGDLGRAYLRKRKGGKSVVVGQEVVGAKGGPGKPGKKKLETEIGKLDDVADCLLQGMAWLKWEENRRLIMEKGLRALDELE